MATRQQKHDFLLDTLNAARRNNEPAIERYEFSDREVQFFTGIVGICSVCGVAAYLANPYVLLGLVAVWYIVREFRPIEAKNEHSIDAAENPEDHDKM